MAARISSSSRPPSGPRAGPGAGAPSSFSTTAALALRGRTAAGPGPLVAPAPYYSPSGPSYGVGVVPPYASSSSSSSARPPSRPPSSSTAYPSGGAAAGARSPSPASAAYGGAAAAASSSSSSSSARPPSRPTSSSAYGSGSPAASAAPFGALASTASAAAPAPGALLSPKEATFCFLVEWNDLQAALVRKYYLYYYELDDTIEMFDIKANRTFLKRVAYPSVHLDDLYIGAQVSIYSRPIKVLQYGDDFTAARLTAHKSRTLALVTPEAVGATGRVIDTINKNKFIIGRLRMFRLTQEQAASFFGDRTLTDRARALARGPVVAIEVVGSGVVQGLREIADVEGKSGTMAGVYLSTSERLAEAELSYMFENASLGSTAQFTNCTLCVVKPHAVLAGYTGRIIDGILADGNYELSALQLFTLDRPAAEEFLEVYKSVLPEYGAMVEHYTSGPCIAMELRGAPDTVVPSFRELCGPLDPDIARHIRPDTLRAAFGVNKVKNAVHCTDLPEDGVLESEFFFSILQKTK